MKRPRLGNVLVARVMVLSSFTRMISSIETFRRSISKSLHIWFKLVEFQDKRKLYFLLITLISLDQEMKLKSLVFILTDMTTT